MVVDTRFAVATHIMCVLAFVRNEYVSATFIGEQITINPVVVRRNLSYLISAGLVRSLGGSKGGYQLARKPESVSLLDVYRSVHPKRKFEKTQGFPVSNCEEGRRADKALLAVFRDVGDSVEKILSNRSLVDVLEGKFNIR